MKSTRISFIVSRYRAVSDYKLASDSLQRFRRAPSSFQRARSSSLTASVARVNSSSTYNKTRIPTLRFLSTMGGPGDGNDKFDGGGDLIEDEEEFGGDYDDEFEDSSDYYDDDIFDEKPEKRKKGKKKNKDESGQRIWLDPSTPLEDRVNRFLNQGLGTIHPLDIALASVDLIRECGKTKSFEGLNFGHDILDRLLEEKRFVNESSIQSGITSSHPPIVISERPFQVLMYGWSNLSSKVSLAPQRMREILDLMIKEAEYDESIKEQFCSTLTTKTMDPNKKLTEQELDTIFADRSCQPTVDIYNTLLQGLVQASRRSIQAAGEAEKVLIRMNKMNRKRGWHTKPNKKSFTLAINAFAKTRHRTAGDRAETVLRKMIEYHEQEKGLYFEETGAEYNMFDPSANRRQIVTPDTIAYTAVIQAYAQSESPDSAEKAVAILTELIQSHSPALKADAFIFANTINVFSNMVVKVRSPSARLNAAERAEEILWLMVHEFIAVKAVSSEKEGSVGGSERKDAEKENGFEASIIPFNACMNVWAQSNLPESAARAEEILFKILDPSMEERTQVQPNVVSFNTCMQAWAKAARTDPNAPNRAEELLNLLIQQGETLGIQPDVQSYTTVMNAYAKSNQKDKAIQTRRLLDLLLSNNDLRKRKNLISAVPFTAILNAVAHSPNMMDMIPDDGDNDENTMFGQDDYEVGDPYSLALETYTALKEDLFDLGAKPDHFAFATMLDAIRQHTDAESIERRQRVESVLYDAQSAGHVSSLVLQALFEACPSKEMLESLLEIRNPLSLQSLKALPREWIRNVPPAFRKLRKTSHNFGVDKKKRGGGKANNKNKRQPKKNQRQE